MKLLEQSDLEALTGRRRPTAQAKALLSMGIYFRTRPDGKIIVIDVDLPMTKQNVTPAPEFTIAS